MDYHDLQGEGPTDMVDSISILVVGIVDILSTYKRKTVTKLITQIALNSWETKQTQLFTLQSLLGFV